MSLDAHVDILTSFAHSHFTGDPTRDAQIQLKITHSLEVLKNAERIIAGEGITGKSTHLCRLAALYHDIGRFPQFARYATFNDRESTNHGRLGVLTLRELNLPGHTSVNDWRIIRFAVAQHNLKEIRAGLPKALRTPTMLVRDADKLDIFRVMIEHFSSDNPDPVVTHGFKDKPGEYTDAVYASVMEKKISDYRLIQCANDFKLLIIGWLFNLHFSTSLKLLIQNGTINRIFSFLPKDVKIQALEKKIDAFIRYNSDCPS